MESTESRSTRVLWVALAGVAPIAVAAALVALRDVMLNANVALVLVLVVVLAAIGGGRAAGAVAAVAAALSFDFFHTAPYLTLQIDSGDDVETTLLLLGVGLAVGHLASMRAKPARPPKTADEIRRIHRVAALGDHSRHTASEMIMAAQTELSELLELDTCQFEAFPFTRSLPRLERTGVVSVMEFHDGGFALPPEGVELPVLGRGNVLGRFVLVPRPGTTVTLEQRIVAVSIADHVGAALSAPEPRRPADPEQRGIPTRG
jgi:hypothetical protein